MTGFEIRNAMRREHGFAPHTDPYELETFDVSAGISRIRRFIMVLMMATKGGI